VWCTLGRVKTAQCTEDGIKGPMMMMHGNLPYLVRPYCKFQVSYHSITEITVNTKGYSVQNLLCQLNHELRSRK